MKQIYANNQTLLQLGRQGENLARQVVFDLSSWVAEYGSGVAELIYQRNGDAAPYPVAAVREGNTLVWTLTATDTVVASSYGSNGHCELRYYVGDVLAKSATWPTKVIPAMSTPSETAPPEPEQGWVDQVLAVGAAAKADADRAAALAAEVAANAAQTAQDATESAQAKEAAQTAHRLAEDAQRAAETAKQAAETAQTAAEQSATDAAGAKQGAEAALKAAQDAAAAAAQSLADLRALYQEMQTWAQGVTQDINEAGSHAVQSVQSAGDEQTQRVAEEGAAQTANAKAQADAAALSAQQAAESAAVYDSVASDVTQLKSDIVTKADKTALARTDRSLDALWKLNQGISYQFETDNAAAYQKTVPSGAKLASVEAVGGNTIVWNRIETHTMKSGIKNGINFVKNEDGTWTVNGEANVDTYYTIVNFVMIERHRYLVYGCPSIGSDNTYYFGSSQNWREYGNGLIFEAKASVYCYSYPMIKAGTVASDLVFAPKVFDLTAMFGAGNEPTSTDDPRIAWVKQYAEAHPEYNAGELVSADVESVLYDGIVAGNIPNAVRALPGYGWSAGDVHNSIERTETGWQYVQRVGSRDYQDGDTVTDGVTTYYVLDTPVITDITDLMDGVLDAIPVEAGGTLTFENAAKLDVPNSVEYAVKLSEVNQ